MDLQKVKPEIDKYVRRLRKEIPVEAVILFGSLAQGRAREDSDIDMVVLSDRFSGMSDDERLKFLYRNSVGFPYDLHVYGLTRKELDTASLLTTAGEAREKGIRIFGSI